MENLAFARGASSRTIRDSIRGRESVIYRFAASAGQRLSITMRTNNPSATFNLGTRPGGEPLHMGAIDGNRVQLLIPRSGNFFVEVYLIRNAARRGEIADYALTVGVTGAPDVDVVDPGLGDPDYADGLAGGPDYWRVSNVAPGDLLNIRARPSASAPIVARAANGMRLRNLGCRMTGPTRWCRVELRDGSIGWAAGRFLRE